MSFPWKSKLTGCPVLNSEPLKQAYKQNYINRAGCIYGNMNMYIDTCMYAARKKRGHGFKEKKEGYICEGFGRGKTSGK